MKPELEKLLKEGRKTVKTLMKELGLSETRVRTLLKENQSVIHCAKNSVGQNEFWLPDDFEASEDELAQQSVRQEVQASKAEDTVASSPTVKGSNNGTPTCPLCQAEAAQVQAGPEGSYLGACRTCTACKKTYNVFTNEEVKMAKEKATGTKRAAPLNPQYKINQKIDAAKVAGGKLTYEREGRTWLLTKKGVEPKRMTALEFSNETQETIQSYLGYEPKPEKAEKSEKPAKATKTSKAREEDLVGA
jgi:transposase-like protein